MSDRREYTQATMTHPLGIKIWRGRRGRVLFAHRVKEAIWILIGRWSLHRAWQRGYDDHIRDESLRRARGGK
jgi:hypothetical protein